MCYKHNWEATNDSYRTIKPVILFEKFYTNFHFNFNLSPHALILEKHKREGRVMGSKPTGCMCKLIN